MGGGRDRGYLIKLFWVMLIYFGRLVLGIIFGGKEGFMFKKFREMSYIVVFFWKVIRFEKVK